MKIESLRLNNFKAFQSVVIKDLPQFCVFVGHNGTGKSTLFSVFEFLKTAMASNVNVALGRLGGSRGFAEVCSRCDQSADVDRGYRHTRYLQKY